MKRKTQEAGFSLVEVTLALGICTFAILTCFGLLAGGLNMNRDSVSNTEAASVACEVAADLRMLEDWNSPTPSLSPRLAILPVTVGSTSPVTFYVNRTGEFVPAASISENDRLVSLFRVDVSFGAATGARPPTAHILVSWPVPVAGTAAWPNTRSTTYEVVASLKPTGNLP